MECRAAVLLPLLFAACAGIATRESMRIGEVVHRPEVVDSRMTRFVAAGDVLYVEAGGTLVRDAQRLELTGHRKLSIPASLRNGWEMELEPGQGPIPEEVLDKQGGREVRVFEESGQTVLAGSHPCLEIKRESKSAGRATYSVRVRCAEMLRRAGKKDAFATFPLARYVPKSEVGEVYERKWWAVPARLLFVPPAYLFDVLTYWPQRWAAKAD